jgi:hypothetical protein
MTNNTSVRSLHNLVGYWSNIDPRTLSITICSTDKYRNGMGMELSIDNYIWDGIFDFH